jgi:photosystem II stability/assembly factor-like uncharacterized protein
MAGSLDQSFGDIERIECPDPGEYGKFDEVGAIRGAEERPTLPLTGRYATDLKSTLLRLARAGCAIDVQIHLGKCKDPSDFDAGFDKIVMAEEAFLTNFSTEDLGTLSSDGQAAVNESSDVSAKQIYEVLQMSTSERGGDVVTNPLVDVVICSTPECGDCDDEDDGCEIIYAVGDSSPGSPGTAPDVIYSIDKGVTLAADEITTMTDSDDADAIACVGTKVVVISHDTDSLHWKEQAVLNVGTAANWTEVTTGFVAAGSPTDMWSVGNYAFICGDGGYIYGTSNPATGVTVLDAGVATNDNLTAVHAISDTFAVTVGDNGRVISTSDRVTWTAATVVTGDPNLTAVWIKTRREWHVGTDAGAYWYTLDAGVTWTQLTNLPITLTDVNDIAFSTDSVGYLAGISAAAGVILRSYNGGQSWVVLPEGAGNIPTSTSVEALAPCRNGADPANFVVGVGADGNDGFYMVGDN